MELIQGTFAELHALIGCVPLERIAATPAPGCATEADVLAPPNGVKHIYELVHGVLIEKAMGYRESELALILGQLLLNFLDVHDIGIALGADGTLKLFPGLVRVPDICFISWNRFPEGKRPTEPIPNLVPDLAVEIISPGNTVQEMDLKLQDYFRAGVKLVWYMYPDRSEARVYTGPDRYTVVGAEDILDGGDVLPGFQVSMRDWTEKAARRPRPQE